MQTKCDNTLYGGDDALKHQIKQFVYYYQYSVYFLFVIRGNITFSHHVLFAAPT